LLTDAGIDQTTPTEEAVLMHFCNSQLPVPKPLLPKLLTLLKCCHESGQKLSNWYFALQETIQNHYRSEGNCFFFGDAKQILSGEMDYSMEEMGVYVEKMQALSLL